MWKRKAKESDQTATGQGKSTHHSSAPHFKIAASSDEEAQQPSRAELPWELDVIMLKTWL